MLDTHAVARSLTEADFTPAQADALTDAIASAARHGDHVTPDQLDVKVAGLRTEIAGVRTEMAELRTEVRSEVAGVRTEMAELRTEVRSEVAGVRTEMAELRTEVRSEVAGVRAEMAKLDGKMSATETRLSWRMLGIAGLIVAALRLFN